MANRKRSVTFSWPEDLILLCEKIALQENVSPSVASAIGFCKAYSVDTEIVTKGARKRRELVSTTAVFHIKHTEAPWPQSFYELSQTKHRPRVHYNILLSKNTSGRWVTHDPGKTCPSECTGLEEDKNHPKITEQERKDIIFLRDTYGYKY